MRIARSSLSRLVAVALAAALVLAAAACESQRVPPWLQGGRTQPQPAAPPPAALPPPAQAGGAVYPRPEGLSPVEAPTAAPPAEPLPSTPSLEQFFRQQATDGAVTLKPPAPPLPALAPGVSRVALLLPLSGANARLGAEMLNAAQLALFDFADDDFEIVVHDTKGTVEGAAEAAALAVSDRAALILGPLLAGEVRAVAPAARAAGVHVVAFSSDRAVAGDGVFIMGFLPGAQVERVVRYARSRGLQRFAAFAPDDGYGAAVVEALKRAAAAAGGQVARVQFYDPAATDFAPAVRHLADFEPRRQALLQQRAELQGKSDELSKKALERLEKLHTIGDVPFDALLIPDGGKRLQAIAAHLPFFDIDPAKVRMLGTGQWDEPGTGAEPALIGGWYAAPPPPARAEFEKRYAEAYGGRPARLATLAYDAAALAAVLARGEGAPPFDAAALTQPTGFLGRDGIFRFLDSGVAERGLAVLQLLPRGAKVISPAPETFEVPTH